MKNNLVAAAACLGLVLLSFSGFAQKRGQEFVDSLEKEIARRGDDTLKAMALGMLSNYWYVKDINKAFPYVNASLRISNKLHWIKGMASAENNLGMFMSDTGNQAGARPHFEISYKLNVQRDSKINIVNNLLNLGRSYSYESNFPTAIDYFFKALRVAEAIKSEQKMASIGTNITSNFFKQGNYPKTLEWARYTIVHAGKAGDTSSLAKGYTFTGNAFLEMKDTAAAIPPLDSSVVVTREAGLRVDLGEAMADRALAESDLAKRVGKEREAEQLMAEVSPNAASHIAMKAALGYDYLRLAQQAAGGGDKAQLLKNAGEQLTAAKSMAERRGNPARLAEVLKFAVELEEYRGEYKTALADHKRMVEITDSLFTQDNKNQIAGLEARHTVDLKDAELALSQEKLSNERKTTIGLVAGVAVLTVLGVLLYRQSSRRRKANAALRQANIELEEANKVKARFFGILSHDLRGPVAQLLHFLEIQKEAPDLLSGAQQETQRRQVVDSAENLLNTMEEMLLWSKQQMQSFRPNPKNTSVSELFDYLQKFFAEPNSVSLLFHADDGLSVFTDENYLRIIMQNLTSNALKALKDRPDATVEWKAAREGENTVLSIADNGPGLPPEQAKALYDESVAENARDGFGLHIIRDLARAIRCKVDVRTAPGKGTEFALIIPAA